MTESMLGKLSKHYEERLKIGNGGHVVCYYNERKDETVLSEYNFQKGIFTVKSTVRDAIHWNYDPKDKHKL